MKRIILLPFIVLFATVVSANNEITSNAQDTIVKTVTTVTETDPVTGVIKTTTTETETTYPVLPSEVIYDGSSYNFIFSWNKKKHLSPHWTGIGISFLNYSDSDIPNGSLKLGQSYAISLNLLDYSIPIKNSNWMLVSGMGFDWFRYHFDDNAALTKVDGVTQFLPAPEGTNYRSTKLLSYYITIPLLMEYQLPLNKKSIYFSAGAVGFIKYYSKSQVKFTDQDGETHKKNMGRDLNIRPVDLKFRLQVGIGGFSAFAYYSPFSMFEKDKGPDLKTYNIGLMMGF